MHHFPPRLSSKSRAVCLFRSALIDAFPSFLSSLHHYLTTSSWSYHHTGTLPRLISFVFHSYENCRGAYPKFPFCFIPSAADRNSSRFLDLHILPTYLRPI